MHVRIVLVGYIADYYLKINIFIMPKYPYH
jgi:hypothetical protein